MPIFRLELEDKSFPPAEFADDSGILAIGGDLSVERIIEAYMGGVFPWFNPDEPPLWWSPDPRFVIFPEKVKISKSTKQILRKKKFRVTFDTDFEGVIKNCEKIYRPGQEGMTWISDELKESFIKLHEMGFAHSVEVWEGDALVGGLYGGVMGKCFFGESMFAKASNASKIGFIYLCRNLEENNFELVDCQVYTSHLESLGGEMLPRHEFLDVVRNNASRTFQQRKWTDYFHTNFEF